METFAETYLKCQQELLDRISSHKSESYFTQHDVSIKTLQKGNLYYTKFKYDDNCRFTYSWQMACRGTTILKNKEYKPYFSLNKFFNQHEIEKHYKMSFQNLLLKLKSEGYSFTYLPKYDGSCIHCFSDTDGNKYRFTLGSLEKNKIGSSLFTYEEITELLLKENYPDLHSFLNCNPDHGLICELITPDNVVKTIYDFYSVNLKSNVKGILKPLVMINSFGLPTFDNILIEHKWDFNETNFEEVKSHAFQQMETNPAKFGINPEGLVAYCFKNNICFPIAKMKRMEYFSFLATNDGEILCKLQMEKINGTIDDIPMSDKQSEHIDEFVKYLDKTAKEFESVELLKTFLSQKEFAKQIEGLLNNKSTSNLYIYKSALFQLRKNGFEFVSGYDAVIKLLLTEFKGKKVIESFQKESGYKWFKKMD
jgi:hypothetical protein